MLLPIKALQKRKEAPRAPKGALRAATGDEGYGRGSRLGFVNPVSLYDRARDYPVTTFALAALGAAFIASHRPCH